MQRRYAIVDHRLKEVHDGPSVLTVYENPDDAEKRTLLDALKLDEHTLQSALDPDELARIEFEPEHAALIFKRPKSYTSADNFLFKVSSVGAYLFKDQLVLVIAEDSALLSGIGVLRGKSPAYILLRLIYKSIFHFLEHIKVIATISDEVQIKINRAMENRHLLNLFTLQKSLVYYLNSINSNGALLDKLKLNAPKLGLDQEELELLDDTQIENAQCYKQAEIYSNIVASLMDARASIVGNNLNVLMKTLNLITVGIMVPTLVVSAFSMNVHIPLESNPYAFYIIMSLATASVLTFLFLWRRLGW